MSVRPATLTDVDRLVELGELLHGMSSYARYSYDPAKVARLLSNVMTGGGVVFVATDAEGNVVGGIAGAVTEHWFSSVDKHGFDLSFFMHPEHRHGMVALKLLRTFETWCAIKGATEIRIGITTGMNVESTTRLYEYCGFAQSGALFTKEVSNGN